MIFINAINEFYKKKKVLVTGHTGFIGSWLSEWLSLLDSEVCGYALDPPTVPNLFETIDLRNSLVDIRGDVRDSILLRKILKEYTPEIVFHLAAQPIVLESYDNPLETFDTNVTGTVNLLNELRHAESVKTIIVMTSDKSYRNNEWVYPYRENDELGGRDPYSASKSCQDIVVNSFRESYFSPSGVTISSIRAGNVIGGGDWSPFRIIPDLVRGTMKDQIIKIRNPNSVRPWQHVLEPVLGMLILGEKISKHGDLSGSWNFGPEHQKEVTVKELTESFINLWGSGSYEIEERKSYKEANYLKLDISKAKNILGWYPRYNFDIALKKTVDWYKFYYKNENMKRFTENQIKEYFLLGEIP